MADSTPPGAAVRRAPLVSGGAPSVYYAVFMKWLILSLILWLAWRLTRRLRRPAPPPPPAAGAGEAMCACVYCGLNVPQSEALDEDGLTYCSEAHRRLGPNRSGRKPR